MDGTGDHHAEQGKSSSERQISHFCLNAESETNIISSNNNYNNKAWLQKVGLFGIGSTRLEDKREGDVGEYKWSTLYSCIKIA
jgi:hypothetical protein